MSRRFVVAALTVGLGAFLWPGSAPRAQTPSAAPVTPAAPDLNTLLFKASDGLGILRGLRQEDSLTTLEFWAHGTMMVDGRPSRVTSYRGSLRFHDVPAMRVDITRVGPDGKPQRVVEAVAGPFAWNETEPGINGTPAPQAAAERMLWLRTLPQGLLKGARAAEANAQIRREGASIVLAYSVPEVANASITATLNDRNLIERVQSKLGSTVTDTTYAGYADWNPKDYKADIWFPGRIVQKRDGVTILDLTVTKTNTYNPYVVVPVPPNVGTLATRRPQGGDRGGTYR
jgi:hypothetical protein